MVARKKRPGKKGLITEFLKPSGMSPDNTGVVPFPPEVTELITVDLLESLLASQSALGPHWGRGVSRKRD